MLKVKLKGRIDLVSSSSAQHRKGEHQVISSLLTALQLLWEGQLRHIVLCITLMSSEAFLLTSIVQGRLGGFGTVRLRIGREIPAVVLGALFCLRNLGNLQMPAGNLSSFL